MKAGYLKCIESVGSGNTINKTDGRRSCLSYLKAHALNIIIVGQKYPILPCLFHFARLGCRLGLNFIPERLLLVPFNLKNVIISWSQDLPIICGRFYLLLPTVHCFLCEIGDVRISCYRRRFLIIVVNFNIVTSLS